MKVNRKLNRSLKRSPRNFDDYDSAFAPYERLGFQPSNIHTLIGTLLVIVATALSMYCYLIFKYITLTSNVLKLEGLLLVSIMITSIVAIIQLRIGVAQGVSNYQSKH